MHTNMFPIVANCRDFPHCFLFMLFALCPLSSHVEAQDQLANKPNPQFPDGISPTHVYARIDLLDRCIDTIAEHTGARISPEEFPLEIESNLQPMHVYQALLMCTWRMQTLDDRIGVALLPTISIQPRTYHPRDVIVVVEMMLTNVLKIGESLGTTDMPTDEMPFEGKTPTDVFHRVVRIFVKLNTLCGYGDLTPAEVFAQMIRATDDVKSILRQADPTCRYYIDIPPLEGERMPADVFARCLKIRQHMNRMRIAMRMEAIPVPPLPVRQSIRPRDVFFQTQIIIAELNLLKKPLNTISSTPLTIPVDDKTPTDVFQQATTVEFLLEQVKTK